jgi:hypothetical protein
MRPALLASLPLAVVGCNADCGNPEQINGTYAVFANVVTYEGDNLAAFPSYQTPANGWSEWDLGWTNLMTQRIGVTIDGQAFEGAGIWNEVECGNFDLRFSGEYTSDIGSVHSFEADGRFVRFAERLEGTWQWSEQWSYEGENGTFNANGELAGELVR